MSWGLSMDKEFQSQGMILHSVFCNYYRATSYHECSCLLFMFTRANFWHNRYICDNWWMSYHYYLCRRFSLYFRCSGWGCFFAYYGSQTTRKCWEWVLITFWFVLLYYFAKQALEYHLRCKRQELCLSIKIEKNKIHNTIQCKLIEGNVFEHWIGPHWFFSELYLLQICICCGFTTWRWASLYLSLYCGD